MADADSLLASYTHTYTHRWIAGFGVTMREHEITAAILAELTTMLGCSNEERSWITDTNIRWQDNFLLSGSTVGGGSGSNLTTQRVWRFTPLDPTVFAPKFGKDALGRFNGDISITATLWMFDEARPCELEFKQAVMHSSESSVRMSRYCSTFFCITSYCACVCRGM